MADEHVTLDASALLTFLRKEPGWQVVEVALTQSAAISLLNLTEVLTKLVEAGADPTSAMADLEREGVIALPETNVVEALVQAVPFLAEDAIEAARLRRATRSLGLSLGDRVCLATAIRLRTPVLTADRRWVEIPNLPVEVRAIR